MRKLPEKVLSAFHNLSALYRVEYVHAEIFLDEIEAEWNKTREPLCSTRASAPKKESPTPVNEYVPEHILKSAADALGDHTCLTSNILARILCVSCKIKERTASVYISRMVRRGFLAKKSIENSGRRGLYLASGANKEAA